MVDLVSRGHDVSYFLLFCGRFWQFFLNNTRLDAGALNFYEDSKIALQMLWQTYPMTWMVLGLITAVLFFRWMFRRSHWTVITRTDGLGICLQTQMVCPLNNFSRIICLREYNLCAFDLEACICTS